MMNLFEKMRIKECEDMKEAKNLKSSKFLHCTKNEVFHKVNQAIYETELSYCLKCRRKIECKKPRVEKTKNGRIILSS